MRALDKKCVNINNEVRSLMEELKTGPEEVIKKKINRPISLGKRKFSKERSVEKLLSLFRSFQERMNHLNTRLQILRETP